jgi:hypothetical protein
MVRAPRNPADPSSVACAETDFTIGSRRIRRSCSLDLNRLLRHIYGAERLGQFST